MEVHSILNQAALRNGIGKENLSSGIDAKIPLMGGAAKRTRLSDITNTVSSSNPNPQFQQEKDSLLKALGERNTMIELSTNELQNVRLAFEKLTQQNRMLAQANSQMLAELTSSKQRLKESQHELGCTVAVLRSKNLELDEKKKMINELREKIRVEERSKLVEVANNGGQSHVVGNQWRTISSSKAFGLDTNSRLDEDKLNKEPCEMTRAEDNSNYKEVETAITLSDSVGNNMVCNPNSKRTRRSRTVGTTALTQAEEKPHEKIRAEDMESLNIEPCRKNVAEEERPNCTEITLDSSRPHLVDNNLASKQINKRELRSRSLGGAAIGADQVEVMEKDDRRKSLRRRSNIPKTEANESKDYLFEIVDPAEVPACSILSEALNEADATGKDDTRKVSRRSNNLKSKPIESKDQFSETSDVKIPACSSIAEPSNEGNINASTRHEEAKAENVPSACSSECRVQEMRELR